MECRSSFGDNEECVHSYGRLIQESSHGGVCILSEMNCGSLWTEIQAMAMQSLVMLVGHNRVYEL